MIGTVSKVVMQKIICCFILIAVCTLGAELPVAVNGNDRNDGCGAKPFRTISAAARVARPGDTVTVTPGPTANGSLRLAEENPMIAESFIRRLRGKRSG